MVYGRQVSMAQTAPWRLTDVGCSEADGEAPSEREVALPWGPGGHICAGSFGTGKGPGKGEMGAGYG